MIAHVEYMNIHMPRVTWYNLEQALCAGRTYSMCCLHSDTYICPTVRFLSDVEFLIILFGRVQIERETNLHSTNASKFRIYLKNRAENHVRSICIIERDNSHTLAISVG